MSTQLMRARLKPSPIKLRGYLEWCVRDAVTGEVVNRGKKKNTVTAKGRGWALHKLTAGSNAQVLSWVAIGSSSAAPSSNDTQLAAYNTIKIIGSSTMTSNTNTTCKLEMAVSFASNETWAESGQIGEFALYNSSASAGATMFNRVIPTAYINFASTNTLAVTITITN